MNFSHIYIEKQCQTHPIAQKIVKQFPQAIIIPITHYKEIFNRPQQSFDAQKKNIKLILAKRETPRVYESTERVRSRDEEKPLYYIDMVRNCIFDCHYCFLQGIHKTANILIFVNIEDYFQVVDSLTHKNDVLVSISYLSDLLALESLGNINQQWIEYAREKKNLTLETRTKSDNFAAIQHIKPHKNIILTWSLNPQIAQKYEHGCASVANRIFQIKKAVHMGWRIRLAFDPILLLDNWMGAYHNFFQDLFTRIQAKQIDAVYVGVFRMQKKQYRYIQLNRPHNELLHSGIIEKTNMVHAKEVTQVRRDLINMLCNYIEKKKILFVHG